MALVIVVLIFLTKKQLAERGAQYRRLSCLDIVHMFRHKRPYKIKLSEDLVITIAYRLQQRRQAAEPQYQNHNLALPISLGG